MTDHPTGPAPTGHPRPSRVLVSTWLAGALLVLLLAAGRLLHWSWTGMGHERQLWDLLHLLVLPCVLGTLPLWYETRHRWRRAWRALFGTVAVAFVVLIVGGYGLGWTWTGFTGNTLWDWLELLALPVAVALMPSWIRTHRSLRREWRAATAVVLAALVVSVLGGYGLHWRWTGFAGNTLLDWLRLLFVPFVLPLAVAWMSARAAERAETAADAAAGPAPAMPSQWGRGDDVAAVGSPGDATDAVERANR